MQPTVSRNHSGKPSIHDATALEAFFRAQRIDPHRLRRWRYLLYHERRPLDRVLAELPADARERLMREFRLTSLELAERHDSQIDRSTKLVFQTAAGRRLETVVMRSGGDRTSVCVSSQVGCAARCVFCATGLMPSVDNLTEDEILDQFMHASDIVRGEGQRLRNVVFMGMGEPLHNEPAVYGALEKLQSQAYFGLSPQRILVSTVGIPDAMRRFAERFPLICMALSLHSASQAFRASLIPVARRYPLDALRAALIDVNRLQKRPVMIEYLMLADANDRDEDADQLAEFLEGLRVHVNLIPFNPFTQGPPFQPTPRPRRDEFANRLRARGLLVTVRYSQGADIGAACGQLITEPRTPADRTRLRSSQDLRHTPCDSVQ